MFVRSIDVGAAQLSESRIIADYTDFTDYWTLGAATRFPISGQQQNTYI